MKDWSETIAESKRQLRRWLDAQPVQASEREPSRQEVLKALEPVMDAIRAEFPDLDARLVVREEN